MGWIDFLFIGKMLKSVYRLDCGWIEKEMFCLQENC